MGLNAVTSVPKYTDGEILEASRLNVTNSGIPVFADATARDAGFGGTGEKVLAEGQYAYLESTNATQYYDGAAWQTVGGGLTLIKSQTIGTAVSSVTVSDVFSATYDNYRVILMGGSSSTTITGRWTLGATATGYYYSARYSDYAGPSGIINGTNATSWAFGAGSASGLMCTFDLLAPNLAEETSIVWTYSDILTAGSAVNGGGFLNNTTQYTSITFAPSSGTLTGGTIRVYGYQNS